MTSLLGNIFSRHSAIVIGYAGWDGDVIMTALKRRLQSRLPNNLYWFCYRRSDADPLPDWLKNHPDVRCVLPPAPPSKPDSQPASEAKLAGIATELEPTLTAQSVLDKLVGVFTEKSPALTLDPIGFFAGQLTKSFPPTATEKPGEDIYSLRDVIRRLELAREGKKKRTPVEDKIELARDALRRSAYPEVLQTARELEAKLTSDAQREAVIESLMTAARGLNDHAEAQIRAYDLVLRLVRGDAGASPRFRGYIAKALVNKGAALAELNRSEEAIQTYEEMLRRFAGTNEPSLRQHVAAGLYNKAVALGRLNRDLEGIQAYDDMLRRLGDPAEPWSREQVAQALYNKGVALGRLNRSAEAIQVYDEILRRFEGASEPSLLEPVAKALCNKGFRLSLADRRIEAIQTWDELIRRFGDATEPALRDPIAKALVGKGRDLYTLGRSEESELAFQEVLKRFADSPDAVAQQAVEAANAHLTPIAELILSPPDPPEPQPKS